MANLKVYTHRYVCYPESIHENFFGILNDFNIPFEYILHDKDIDENGNLKKAHYHVIFGRRLKKKEREIVIKYGNVKVISDVNYPEECEQYLTHDNDSEKYQYSKDNIIKSDGWSDDDFQQMIEDSKKVKSFKGKSDDTCFSVFSDIIEHEISSFSSLVNFYISNEEKEKLSYCVSKAYAIKTYISENRYIFVKADEIND